VGKKIMVVASDCYCGIIYPKSRCSNPPRPFFVYHSWMEKIPGSSPAYCTKNSMYNMRQKAGEEPGNDASNWIVTSLLTIMTSLLTRI